MVFKQLPILFACLILFALRTAAQEVLIVADEIPAMEVLAQAFEKQESIHCKIVTQPDMPALLTNFKAVIVYIHKDMDSTAEKAFINYTKNGGKLICLHHSISSMKRKNEGWLPFLGVDLPKKDVNEGGYKYVGGINMAVVNLAPTHFITTNKIQYDSTIIYKKEAQTAEKPESGFVLYNTEAFVNHNLLSPRTILLGFKSKTQQEKYGCKTVRRGVCLWEKAGFFTVNLDTP